MKYEVSTPNDDPTLAVIHKSGITHDFTLAEVMADRQRLETHRMEISGMYAVEQAKITNILSTNPEIANVDENMLKVYYIYQRALSITAEAKEKLAEIDALITQYEAELKDISEQTGLAIPTPVVASETPSEPEAPVEVIPAPSEPIA